MPIENYEFENGGCGPRIFCDVCGEAISDPDEGIVCWRPSGGYCPGERFLTRFACKDECLRRLDHKYGHQHTQPINAWFVFLRNNARIDIKAGEISACLLSSL